MYIDVLTLSSVSEAVHEASRMLRVGIMRAMATDIDDDLGATESTDRHKSQSDLSQSKCQQIYEKDHMSVYSAVSKRTRRTVPEAIDIPTPKLSLQVQDDASATANRATFAPRSWNATKRAGPSILAKRTRSLMVSGSPNSESDNPSVFQPGPKREKHLDICAKENEHAFTPSESVEQRKTDGSSGTRVDESMSQLFKSKRIRKHTEGSQNGEARLKKPHLAADKAQPSSIKTTVARPIPLKRGAAEFEKTTDRPQTQKETTRPPHTPLSPGTRKLGLPPSWCQVSTKSFNHSVTRQASTLSLLRKPGPTKQKELLVAPRGSTALPTLPARAQPGKGNLVQPTSGTSVLESRGLIPLPSSTGNKVKYVPGSEIIDGVRPNGYIISIDGVVKPVVTFNPKPKLPHKLRQSSVERLFEAWKDVRKVAEGEALSRALRTEQEIYARATSRADYRAAVTVTLRDTRKPEA